MKSFKKKFLAVLTAVTMLSSCVVTTGVSVSAATTTDLPTNAVIGYWHNFDNGSTTTKLADINKNWDVVIASFITTGSDLCTAEFDVDPAIYPTNSKAEFIADVKELQARGVKVMVSLGGQNGHIELNDDAARDKFLSTCTAVLKEYGFDGLDIDLEGSSITAGAGDTVDVCSTPIQKNLNYILHELAKEFGPDFMLTMAPEHPYVQGGMTAIAGPWGAYLPLLNNCRDILTFIHPQYYNNPIDYWLPDGSRITGYGAESLVALSEMLINGFATPTGDFEGLRPDQVAFGVPCSSSAANTGQISIAESQEALKTLITRYPSFRGVMTWSINWDEAQNNDGFVEGMQEAIKEAQANLPELEISSLNASAAGSVKLGTEVSWTIDATGGTLPYQYKFQVYKNNALVATQDFSSNAGTKATLSTAGSYKVTATVKDTAGTIISKTSDIIVADPNVTTDPETPSVGGATGELPTNVVIGYWHDFDNGSTTTKLGDVNKNWDVVIASFLTTGPSYCEADFVVDPAIYPSNSKAEFIKDVRELQARGVRVMVSLGGQNGHIDLSTDEKRDTFLKTCIEVIKEFGFDGLDVDLEGSSITLGAGDTVETCASPIQKNLNYVLHELVNEFGSDFMITMAPEHPYVQGGIVAMGTPWGAYLPLLNNCRDILTFIHPQYYNNGIGYSLPDGTKIQGFNSDSLVKLSEMLINGFTTNYGTGQTFEGLRPDQVAFGVPASKSAANTGQLSIAAYQTALKTLIEKYPTFRGIMTWSTNWDEKENNSGFVNGMSATIDEVGDGSVGGGTGSGDGDGGDTTTPPQTTEPLKVASFTPSVTGTVETDIDVSWVVNVTGGKAPYQYQIELMKDNKVVATQAYSSNSGTSTTITEAGKYKIKATVKDAEGTIVSRISGVITAVEPIITPPPATNKTEYAMKIGSSNAYNAGKVEPVQDSVINNITYTPTVQFYKGKTYLPIRNVAETIGLSVSYDAASSMSTVSDGTKTVKIVPNSTNIIVVENGTETTIDTGYQPIYICGVTHIQVRAVIEQFGYHVNWDAEGYLFVTSDELTGDALDKFASDVKSTLA